MAFAIPTVDEFKAQFERDFPYAVPSYGATAVATVVAGVVTAIDPVSDGRLYQNAPTVTVGAPPSGGTQAEATATVSGGSVASYTVTIGGAGYTSAPSVTVTSNDGDDTNLSKVTNNDIQGAFVDSQFNINQGLFSTQEFFARAFNYLAAHYLVEKILASTQGLASQYNWLTTQKNVGQIQSAYGIPDRIMKDPMLAYLSRTRYGATYLAIISPLLIGNLQVSPRKTLP